MGFDIFINLVLHMCHEQGKPFFYDHTDQGELFKNYEIPQIVIPEDYRRFLKERGSIFHAYTEGFEQNDISSVDVSEFLDEFPKWKDVLKSDWYDERNDRWTEDDHKEFKQALTWLSNQKVSFQVSWC